MPTRGPDEHAWRSLRRLRRLYPSALHAYSLRRAVSPQSLQRRNGLSDTWRYGRRLSAPLLEAQRLRAGSRPRVRLSQQGTPVA